MRAAGSRSRRTREDHAAAGHQGVRPIVVEVDPRLGAPVVVARQDDEAPGAAECRAAAVSFRVTASWSRRRNSTKSARRAASSTGFNVGVTREPCAAHGLTTGRPCAGLVEGTNSVAAIATARSLIPS